MPKSKAIASDANHAIALSNCLEQFNEYLSHHTQYRSMTKTPGAYHEGDGKPLNQPKSPSEIIAQSFREGMEGFPVKADFVEFCEILDLTPDDYAERQYQSFQRLVENLNDFDVEMWQKG